MPFDKILDWLKKEEELGSLDAMNIILATADGTGTPHSRVVAIREIAEDSIFFFSQRNTRKVQDLKENPKASLTLWLPLQEREVMLDGLVNAIGEEEKEYYWKNLPRERQLRFSVYAKTCMQPITSNEILQRNYDELAKKFEGREISASQDYCGFRFTPYRVSFYTVGNEDFSEILKYTLVEGVWQHQILSP